MCETHKISLEQSQINIINSSDTQTKNLSLQKFFADFLSFARYNPIKLSAYSKNPSIKELVYIAPLCFTLTISDQKNREW